MGPASRPQLLPQRRLVRHDHPRGLSDGRCHSSAGTTHFSPWSYDRHVPLGFYGAPFAPGIYHGRVAPVDLAATWAALLGINQPSASVGHILTQALKPAADVTYPKPKPTPPVRIHHPHPAPAQPRPPSCYPEGHPPMNAVERRSQPSLNAVATLYPAPASCTLLGSRRQHNMKPDMRVTFCGLELLNPVIAASGTFGYGVEFEDIVNFRPHRRLRHQRPLPRAHGRQPRAAPHRNRRRHDQRHRPAKRRRRSVHRATNCRLSRKYPGCAVIVNVFGNQIEDYVAVIERLNEAEGIAAYEINASCPNTKHGGMVFGSDCRLALRSRSRRAKARSQPPAHRQALAQRHPHRRRWPRPPQHAGADALSLVNTFLAMAIDAETRRPRLANITGGLSGPAIKPIAVRMVWEAAKAVQNSRSSDWAASSPPKTPSNSSSPEPPPSRSAPPATPTPAPPNASPTDWSNGAPATTWPASRI